MNKPDELTKQHRAYVAALRRDPHGAATPERAARDEREAQALRMIFAGWQRAAGAAGGES